MGGNSILKRIFMPRFPSIGGCSDQMADSRVLGIDSRGFQSDLNWWRLIPSPIPVFKTLVLISSQDPPGHDGNEAVGVKGDKYRFHIYGEGEKNTTWRFGAPPNYDVVNKLFEEDRSKEWPSGSIEEKVQNLVKTFEMELFHKACLDDYKTINSQKFTLSINGGRSMSVEEVGKIGGYNALLQTSLADRLHAYNPYTETPESSDELFRTTFPRGFALEILQVYSGPPVIAYKFRHWGYMEGPFKGHSPTGKKVELYGVSIVEVDDSMRIEKLDFFYDAGELLADLLKGPILEGFEYDTSPNSSLGCPFLKGM
ncbi:pathogen-related protein-like [Macadamia integrifolia]|uniref:pathogen-related protein-like n=1 Tax=Macadamia integrifolia TaxID=60698 RepID=UPI001C4FBD71|nr:pathogen-related protein-like [Macadamia integrifolia]XP_042494271.1 pathogen-related protein-like [Macadamia integrifolia]